MPRIVIRLASYGCVVALIVLSLLPKEEMIRTGAPGNVEHFIAYFLSAIVLALGADKGGRPKVAIGLAALAAALELLQQVSPGRTPRLADFLASSAGGLLGVVLTTIVLSSVLYRRPVR